MSLGDANAQVKNCGPEAIALIGAKYHKTLRRMKNIL